MSIKKIICLLLLSVVLFSLASCGGKPEKDEALDIANDLILRAYILNIACYGEGLEYNDDGNPSTVYSNVSSNAPFQTKPEMEKEIDSVFTKDLAETMKEIAFVGQSGLISSTMNYARYLYYSDEEFLKVYENIEGFEIREPDIEKTEITKVKSKKILGKITYKNGEIEQFILKKENGTWKLDTTTY